MLVYLVRINIIEKVPFIERYFDVNLLNTISEKANTQGL